MNMSSPGLEMSLERQIPVLLNKTQMNGEHGAQCGLTSLLPMSCRGRAAAFARDLHTRLQSLGTAHQDDSEGENGWLTRDQDTTALHRATSTSPREHDTFYDFELECESPSSPVDEIDAPFSDRTPTDEPEPPFYDVDAEPEDNGLNKFKLHQPDKRTNGFTFSTTFFTESSPIKLQPAPRVNGHSEKHLYSPITFEGCARQNSQDEVDCAPSTLYLPSERLSPTANVANLIDSEDSEFESAKSEPSGDELIDNERTVNDEVTQVPDVTDNLSFDEKEAIVEDITSDEKVEENVTENAVITNGTLERVPDEVEENKENNVSLDLDGDKSQLNTEIETKNDNHESEEDDRPQRVRGCSSLKTGKTPPGTPGRKKIVRFADVLGLDLADVKTFMDEIPVIPTSAYNDLTGADMVQNSPPSRPAPRVGALTLVPLFQVPRDLTEKLEKYNVTLESARVGDGVHITICGSVRVRNLDFHKTVHIRYTMNRWKTFTDLQATYAPASCDGYSDRFQFMLYAPCIASGQRLEFALRFQCKGQQFWDNNSGANYCYDCLALGAALQGPASPAGPLHPTLDWHPSFY